MCRCCHSCWEELYWNCVEEKFCYDETIANYNPDEDEHIIKNDNLIPTINRSNNNNVPICTQPLNSITSNQTYPSSKIHEEDYRREIQTSVPILAPEILAVFSNSQIFIDHQPKLSRTLTKSLIPAVHGREKEIDQEKLIKRLEGNTENENISPKKIKFTIAPESPSETRRSVSPQQFAVIIEEDNEKEELILRPPKYEDEFSNYPKNLNIENKRLRHVQSVPYFPFRPASENDIFAISGSLSRISMTPEIPSISYSTLPKHYEDTPTIDKYKESVSLYSIQTANQAKASQLDYSMPRYFRKSGLIAQSADMIPSKKEDAPRRVEKSKRLKQLRGSLPPLRIHSVRLRSKEEAKHMM